MRHCQPQQQQQQQQQQRWNSNTSGSCSGKSRRCLPASQPAGNSFCYLGKIAWRGHGTLSDCRTPQDCECNSGLDGGRNWGPLSWRTCAQYVIFVSNDLHTGAGDSNLSDSRGDSESEAEADADSDSDSDFDSDASQAVKPGLGNHSSFKDPCNHCAQ
uniref:GG17042 n=1 Tax=Drosophila erecta TaxID=7220 RepID=B3P438_DROER